MSVFTESFNINDLDAKRSSDGVYVVLRSGHVMHHVIEIKTPMEAHMFRHAVNKACDIILENEKK